MATFPARYAAPVAESAPQPAYWTPGRIGAAVLVGGAAIGGTVWLIRRLRRERLENDFADDPNAAAAVAVRNAINPSGFRAMMSVDGTDEDALFKLAQQPGLDWKAVAKAYRGLYNSGMIEDLQQELSADDYAKFINLIQHRTSAQEFGQEAVIPDKAPNADKCKEWENYECPWYLGLPCQAYKKVAQSYYCP